MGIVRTLISSAFDGCLQHQIEFLAVFVELGACSFLSVEVFLFELAAERWIFPLKLLGGSICSFKRIIPVLRLVQVHVHSCTQHRDWYTSDRGIAV